MTVEDAGLGGLQADHPLQMVMAGTPGTPGQIVFQGAVMGRHLLDLNQDGSDLAPGIVTGSIPADTGETDAVNQLDATGGARASEGPIGRGEATCLGHGRLRGGSGAGRGARSM